ncbi:MAG: hypothetical protein ACREEM_05510 [Blastocatellia bacterium]
MTTPEMTNREMKESLASLLQWRDKAERRLAEAERQLKEVMKDREYGEKWYSDSDEGLDFFLPTFDEVAWKLARDWLWMEFGLGSSVSNTISYLDNGERHTTGPMIWDGNRKRNEVYFFQSSSQGDSFALDYLVEKLESFHRGKNIEMKGRKAYGLLATLPDTPDEFHQSILQQGIYLAFINERERKLEMAVPTDFVPKDFGS